MKPADPTLDRAFDHRMSATFIGLAQELASELDPSFWQVLQFHLPCIKSRPVREHASPTQKVQPLPTTGLGQLWRRMRDRGPDGASECRASVKSGH